MPLRQVQAESEVLQSEHTCVFINPLLPFPRGNDYVTAPWVVLLCPTEVALNRSNRPKQYFLSLYTESFRERTENYSKQGSGFRNEGLWVLATNPGIQEKMLDNHHLECSISCNMQGNSPTMLPEAKKKNVFRVKCLSENSFKARKADELCS